MEAQEEVIIMGSKDQTQIIKGKRTKRQRLPSPLALAMASSSSSAGEGFGCGRVLGDNSGGVIDRATATSSTTSVEFSERTEEEEEEDMANCLILLAQGQSQKWHEPAAATTTKVGGFCVYQCKTCNRCFPSFQALGGHRASHKKPKAVIEEKKAVVSLINEEEAEIFINAASTTLSLQIVNRVNSSNTNKSKVHECSVCGAEFSSGQALGGHMRRHRTFMSSLARSTPDESAKKPRNILSLDLNLPAPDEDFRESKFPFASKEQVIVFSASPLVDCHY